MLRGGYNSVRSRGFEDASMAVALDFCTGARDAKMVIGCLLKSTASVEEGGLEIPFPFALEFCKQKGQLFEKIDLRDSGEPRGQVAKVLTTRIKLSVMALANNGKTLRSQLSASYYRLSMMDMIDSKLKVAYISIVLYQYSGVPIGTI